MPLKTDEIQYFLKLPFFTIQFMKRGTRIPYFGAFWGGPYMTIIQKTIGQMIAEIAQSYPNRDALVHTETGTRYDYNQLSHQIDRTARGFLNQGLQPGDRVALWASNVPEWIFAVLGLAKIGAMTVPIDPAASEDSLRYMLLQSESCGLIVAGQNGD